MAATTSGRLVALLDEDPLAGPRIVRLHGELDVSNEDLVTQACIAPGVTDVVVDLSGLRFMSCSGYGALISARRTLEAREGSLRMRSERGQPRRLIALIAAAS
jgi:anti-anti-sigma factor